MKRLLAALLCLAVLCVAGCGETPGNVESTDGSTVGTAGTSDDGTGTVGTNETPSSAESTADTTGEDTPGPVTPPAVQAWYPIDSGMTETPTRVLVYMSQLYYYNKLDGQFYTFCFDPLCLHQTEECLAYRLARSLVCGQNIEYSDYNGRLYVLRGQKIYSLRSDGSDVRLECSFGERGDWNEVVMVGETTESLQKMTLQGRYLYAENIVRQDNRTVTTLVCYDMETGEVKTLEVGESERYNDYFVGEDCLYVAFFPSDAIEKEWYRMDPMLTTRERIEETDFFAEAHSMRALFDGRTLCFVEYREDQNADGSSVDYGEIKLYDFESGEQKVLYEMEAQHNSTIKLLAMTEESIYFTVYDPLYLGTYMDSRTGRETVYTNDYHQIYRMDRDGGNLTMIMDDISCEVSNIILLDSKILIYGHICQEIEGSHSAKKVSNMMATLDEDGMVTSIQEKINNYGMILD